MAEEKQVKQEEAGKELPEKTLEDAAGGTEFRKYRESLTRMYETANG